MHLTLLTRSIVPCRQTHLICTLQAEQEEGVFRLHLNCLKQPLTISNHCSPALQIQSKVSTRLILFYCDAISQAHHESRPGQGASNCPSDICWDDNNQENAALIHSLARPPNRYLSPHNVFVNSTSQRSRAMNSIKCHYECARPRKHNRRSLSRQKQPAIVVDISKSRGGEKGERKSTWNCKLCHISLLLAARFKCIHISMHLQSRWSAQATLNLHPSGNHRRTSPAFLAIPHSSCRSLHYPVPITPQKHQHHQLRPDMVCVKANKDRDGLDREEFSMKSSRSWVPFGGRNKQQRRS